jgi:dTDP-4-dehydrorhamnose reductase
VVRTAWVYGAAGVNIAKTMARLEKARETVSVVDDQHGSPTWSLHLARALLELAASAAPAGIYHATGGGATTWCGFAKAVFEELGADPGRVLPITTAEYPTPATRPAYSVLSSTSWTDAGLAPLPDWREALAAAFADPAVGPALRAG